MGQFIRLIRSIGHIATAAHNAAPEEERELALRCIQECLCAVTRPVNPQDADKKAHQVLNAIGSGSSNSAGNASKDIMPINYSLREFLRSKEAAPSVGYLLSLCIQVADEEASAAQLGSKALYGRALQTLRYLIEAVRLTLSPNLRMVAN